MLEQHRTGGVTAGTRGARRRLVMAMFVLLLWAASCPARPARLVIALDGVAYRDMQALQAGVKRTNFWGRQFTLRAFAQDEGYFPVSRMVSTFPSASDVAWTDIFGDRPLPGYQRTYFSTRVNSMISINPITTTMEHERQMDWQVQNGFLRAIGYLFPAHTFRYEMRGTVVNFWRCTGNQHDYYVYLRASDDSQHLDRDILGLLCEFDGRLQELRKRYRASEGHDLQIVILSDHGHNHAGRGKRVRDAEFLRQAGYRVANSIRGPKDVVLPICGIESWIELHCAPAESETLAGKLCRMEGTDVVAATLPNQTNRFLVLNAKRERAVVEWHPAQNSFRYDAEQGDPLGYRPVAEVLSRAGQLDAAGFGTADAWMAATMTNYYPLALERIVRGLTRAALNPATILISLDNRYVNDDWLTDEGSRLVACRSTHGGLDAICSDGILLSNFKPTVDTSTDRVAGQFEDFPGVRNFRAHESGGELVTRTEQSLVRIPHEAFDRDWRQLSPDVVYLRIWGPQVAQMGEHAAVDVSIRMVPEYSTSPAPRHFVLDQPVLMPPGSRWERIYTLPPDLKLEPGAHYEISGWADKGTDPTALFWFPLFTTPDGVPAPF